MKKFILTLIFMAVVKLIFSQETVQVYRNGTLISTTTLTATTMSTKQCISVMMGDSVLLINSSSCNLTHRNMSNVTIDQTTISDPVYNLSLVKLVQTRIIVSNDTIGYYKLGNTLTLNIYYFKLFVQNIATGIADLKLNTSKLTVFPNPAIDEVNVSFTANKEKTPIEVFDIQGRLVMLEETEREIGHNKVSLNISNFSAGIYIVRAGSETFKITKI